MLHQRSIVHKRKTSFTCNDNDNDDDDCLRGVGNSETKFAGCKGKGILNEGEDCLRRDNVDDAASLRSPPYRGGSAICIGGG